MKITKRQLRRIIKEERTRVLTEQMSINPQAIYDALETEVMATIPPEMDFVGRGEFNQFRAAVMDSLQQLEDRVVR